MQQPCSIFRAAFPPIATKSYFFPLNSCFFTYYFSIMGDQTRNTKTIVSSYFNSLIFVFLTSSYYFMSLSATLLYLFIHWHAGSRAWQMWTTPELAGLTLDSVWVMKAIKPTVTLTCQSRVVYCRLQQCPSLTYTEVVNTISTSVEVARRATLLLLLLQHNNTAESKWVTSRFVQGIARHVKVKIWHVWSFTQ